MRWLTRRVRLIRRRRADRGSREHGFRGPARRWRGHGHAGHDRRRGRHLARAAPAAKRRGRSVDGPGRHLREGRDQVRPDQDAVDARPVAGRQRRERPRVAVWTPAAGTVKGQCAREPSGTNFPGMPDVRLGHDDAAITDLTECPPLPTWLKNTAGIPVRRELLAHRNGGRLDDPAEGVLPAACRRRIGRLGDGLRTSRLGHSQGRTRPPCRSRSRPASGRSRPPTAPTTCHEGPTGRQARLRARPVRLAEPLAGDGHHAARPERRVRRLHVERQGHPGGFGYVDGTNCSALVTSGGLGPDRHRQQRLRRPARTSMPGLVGTVIALPVFDCIVGVPQRAVRRHLQPLPAPATRPEGLQRQQHAGTTSPGWAKFYLSGYKLERAGTRTASCRAGTPRAPAPAAAQRCLFGWFLKGTLDAATGRSSHQTATPTSGPTQVLPAG